MKCPLNTFQAKEILSIVQNPTQAFPVSPSWKHPSPLSFEQVYLLHSVYSIRGTKLGTMLAQHSGAPTLESFQHISNRKGLITQLRKIILFLRKISL